MWIANVLTASSVIMMAQISSLRLERVDIKANVGSTAIFYSAGMVYGPSMAHAALAHFHIPFTRTVVIIAFTASRSVDVNVHSGLSEDGLMWC